MSIPKVDVKANNGNVSQQPLQKIKKTFTTFTAKVFSRNAKTEKLMKDMGEMIHTATGKNHNGIETKNPSIDQYKLIIYISKKITKEINKIDKEIDNLGIQIFLPQVKKKLLENKEQLRTMQNLATIQLNKTHKILKATKNETDPKEFIKQAMVFRGAISSDKKSFDQALLKLIVNDLNFDQYIDPLIENLPDDMQLLLPENMGSREFKEQHLELKKSPYTQIEKMIKDHKNS